MSSPLPSRTTTPSPPAAGSRGIARALRPLLGTVIGAAIGLGFMIVYLMTHRIPGVDSGGGVMPGGGVRFLIWLAGIATGLVGGAIAGALVGALFAGARVLAIALTLTALVGFVAWFHVRATDRGDKFIDAASRGDVAVVRVLLHDGMKPDTRARTALHETAAVIAAEFHRGEVVRVLLDAGADPNAFDPGTRRTLLVLTGRDGDVQTVRALLAHGADPRFSPPNTPDIVTMLAQHRFPLEVAALLGDALRAPPPAPVSR